MSPDDPAAPPPDAILAVDPAVLAGALITIPDRENALLRLADGRRTVEEVVAGSGLEAAAASVALVRLLDAGVLRVVPPPRRWWSIPGRKRPTGSPIRRRRSSPNPGPSFRPRSRSQPPCPWQPGP